MIRILVVDDDGKVREVVAAMLAALGHTVLEAPDGLAAITMLEAKSAVDLVARAPDEPVWGRASQARSSPSARSLGESRGFGGGPCLRRDRAPQLDR